MRRWIWVMTGLLSLSLQAQKKWDGGAGTSQWNDELNWFPDGVPLPTDDIILDNALLPASYSISLPPGAVTISVRSITIQPASSTISLEIPAGNTGNPGLALTATVDALVIHPGGIFRNASGASAGSGLNSAGPIRILDGGRYVHQTARSNALIIDKLLVQPGSEKGIFEFDVPGTAGYTVSLTGNNFGSLHFSASSSGGTKSYSGSGSGTLTIRGDLIVGTGAQVTSTLTADMVIGGELKVDGRLSLNPSTSGTVARSLRFIGKDSRLSGSGQLLFNTNFRNIEIARDASVYLDRDIILSQASQSFISRGRLVLNEHLVSGPGSFLLADTGTLEVSDPSGIWAVVDNGNIRTATRFYSTRANYLFRGLSQQQTGDGIPDSVASLGIDNPQGLVLSRSVFVRDSLLLVNGRILSSQTSMLSIGKVQVRSRLSRYGRADEGSESSFVEGSLALHLDPGEQQVAPVGWDTVFAPVSLKSRNTARERIIIRYVPEAHPERNAPLLHWLSTREYWELGQSPGSVVELSISARPWSFPPDAGAIPVVGIRTVSGTWAHLPSVSDTGTYRWLRSDSVATGLTHAAPATVLDPFLLPLELISFTAREEQQGFKLYWEAEEDGTPVRYRLLRSGDGRIFEEIGSVYSSRLQRAMHSWQDRLPLPVNYYQLVMETNGQRISSKVIRRSLGQPFARVYPNPVKDELNIFFSGPCSNYEIDIVSVSGTVCKKFVCNTAICRLRVDDLKRGFYLVRFFDRTGLVILPFTKD